MLKPVAAFAILAASASALAAPAPTPVAQWTLAGGNQGCAIHASSPQGTVVSVIASAGQDNLVILVQNRGWSLRDGARYPVAVAFDGSAPWQVEATARTNIDNDGPGLLFAVPTGDSERARDFLAEFSSAQGMQFRRAGDSVASVPLGSGQSAMTALAQCVGRVWSGDTPNVTEAGFGGGRAVKI